MALNGSLDPALDQQLNESFLPNISDLIGDVVDHDIISKYQRNRNIEEPAFSLLIAAYCILIIVGAAGNSLVVCVVVRKRTMRTARNMFIVNLAVSDMLLCLITMPFTLMEILTKYWPLGRLAFFCKIIGTLQATSIYVSSISNTAIALDRYQVIVYPTRENLQKVGAVVILGCIWLASLVLASPLFIWRTLNHYEINLPDIEYIAYCLEDWPMEHGRVYYSIFSLVFQYVLPFITVTIAYSRICRKLRYRYVNSSIGKGKAAVGAGSAGASSGSSRRKAKGDRRMKRTNTLLVCTALIFCISWLPLNIFNIVMDLWNPVIKDSESMLITYAIMHMMGMSSACSNPLLYGWLNDNFRKEFQEILALLCPCVPVEAMRERVGSLKSSVSRRRRRRHKSTSGTSGASGMPAGGGGGGPGCGGGGSGGGGAGGGAGGGPQRGHPYGALPDVLMGDEATSGEGGDRDETVVAISGWRRGTETLTTTENGTGMLQQDTEMISLSRA